MNQTFITLIPKTQGASTISQFIPISIVNTLYKIVSKLIANRLVHVIPELIAHNQTTFIKERLISNKYALVEEMIKDYNQKITPSMACISTDISKALNHYPGMLYNLH